MFFVCNETFIWSRDQRIMRLCSCWPNITCHHLVEFGRHEPCKNRDLTFFIRHVTFVSYDHFEWWSLFISHHPAKFSGHRPYGTGNIFFVCHVTSLDHMVYDHKVMWLCNMRLLIISHHPVTFGGHKSRENWDVTFLFVTWPDADVSTWSTGHVTLWITSFLQKSLSCHIWSFVCLVFKNENKWILKL